MYDINLFEAESFGENCMLERKLHQWILSGPEEATFTKTIGGHPAVTFGSNLGFHRDENQDRVAGIWVNGGGVSGRSFCTIALCDGMGGMKNGELSASKALSVFLSQMVLGRKMSIEKALLNATLVADEIVRQEFGGGSTISAVTFINGSVFTLNVGDSRIYSIGNRGITRRHSQDDNLKAFGGNDEGLLNYIGMGEGIQPHIQKLEGGLGVVLLTSDGVHCLENSVLEAIGAHSHSIDNLTDRLIKAALWTGGKDNASAVAISEEIISAEILNQREAEISIWGLKGELQVIWGETPKVLSKEQIEKFESKSDEPSIAETTSEEIKELDLRGGKTKKPRKKRTPKKVEKIEKVEVGFGDQEREP